MLTDADGCQLEILRNVQYQNCLLYTSSDLRESQREPKQCCEKKNKQERTRGEMTLAKETTKASEGSFNP